MSVGDMTIQGREYTYELTVDDFMAIEHCDDEAESYEDTLCAQLSNLVRNVEYNGHFGSYIYFTIDDDDDCEELRGQIRRMIETYAK